MLREYRIRLICPSQELLVKHDEHRISLIGFLILMALTTATGISVYAVMLHQTESILSKSLATSLKNTAYLLDSQITQGTANTRMIATRPFVIDSLMRMKLSPVASRTDLQRVAESFLSHHGFKAVSFYDAGDMQIASAGRFSPHADFRFRLDAKRSLYLFWEDQFMLHARIEILDYRGTRIGSVATEAELTPLNDAFAGLTAIGKTGEFALCAPVENDPEYMDCLLNRISGRKFQRLHRVIEDMALPMNYALEGKSGIILTKDYRRKEVVAAYAPVGKRGLGTVLKIDQGELYGPITAQLEHVALLIAALVLLGGLLLYWLMTPLVRQLADSRREQFEIGERLQAILDNAPVGIWLTGLNGDLRFMNKTLCNAMGGMESGMQALSAANCEGFSGEAPYTCHGTLNFADGRPHLLEITRVKLHDYTGKVIGVIGISTDITERQQAEESRQLAATVLNTIDEAVLVTDATNNIITVNPAFTAITGYSAEEVIGKNPKLLSSGLHDAGFYRAMWEKLATKGNWSGEIHDRRKNGEVFIEWLSIHQIRDKGGNLTHHVAVFSDISQRKMAEERIYHLAHYDILTNLPNRTLFTDRLRQAIVKAKRDRTHMALMFIDLDKFKQVNDTLGHQAGDSLLMETAKRLKGCVRESDTAGRMGGDEFVVLLEDIDNEMDAIAVAEKILHALDQPFGLGGHSLHISSSIGVAIYPEHGLDDGTLIRNADAAMYRAKASGGAAKVLFSPPQ